MSAIPTLPNVLSFAVNYKHGVSAQRVFLILTGISDVDLPRNVQNSFYRSLYFFPFTQVTAHFKCSTSCCRFHQRPPLCVIQDHIPVPAAAVPVHLYVLLSHHRVPAADNQHSNQQSQGPDGQSLYTEYERSCQQHELCQCEFDIQERNYWQVNNQLVAFTRIIHPQYLIKKTGSVLISYHWSAFA